ncbi:MAG: hypothetical protein GWO20_19485 [Candidatus Korarchaeota archaeon]|nr:hypothetical protein [Candidatus Korarchaeota archaeon]NIU83661.1 hypothetical protein [Candidatus Thorarchaeota archaeon]NIW15536.1 hypothetical protein [Candidatus Thorarchaeota archaeon]NIW53482.1 hypothetical protein [Candidatus Korarchaeota archaeon]
MSEKESTESKTLENSTEGGRSETSNTRGNRKDIIAITIVTLLISSTSFIGFFLVLSILFTLYFILSPILFNGTFNYVKIVKWSVFSVILYVLLDAILHWLKKEETYRF